MFVVYTCLVDWWNLLHSIGVWPPSNRRLRHGDRSAHHVPHGLDQHQGEGKFDFVSCYTCLVFLLGIPTRDWLFMMHRVCENKSSKGWRWCWGSNHPGVILAQSSIPCPYSVCLWKNPEKTAHFDASARTKICPPWPLAAWVFSYSMCTHFRSATLVFGETCNDVDYIFLPAIALFSSLQEVLLFPAMKPHEDTPTSNDVGKSLWFHAEVFGLFFCDINGDSCTHTWV